MEFRSGDPNFRVSWLLGLRPYRKHQVVARCPRWAKANATSCPEWAKEFETDDPSFQVSCLLGLIPSLDTSHRAAHKTLREEKKWDVFGLRVLYGDLPDETAELKAANANQIKWDIYGLRRLFGDLPTIEVEDVETNETEKAKETEQSEEDENPTLATSEFLSLCEGLELLLDDIENEAENDDDDNHDTQSMDGLSPEDCEDDSPSRLEWLRQKTVEKAENEHLDKLMSLPGLEETKAFFLHAKAKVQAATRRGTSLSKVNFDVVLTGNQGTGKTFVAKLYAKFLTSLGIVKQISPRKWPGVEVISAYKFSKTQIISNMRNKAESYGGCIAIIDHAHLLNSDEDNLWNFCIRARRLSGNIVFIFAGDAGCGLSSQLANYAEAEHHLPILKLPNYTNDQLREVFHGMARVHFDKKMEVEGGYDGIFLNILVRRLTRATSEESFTNIWALRTAFHDVCKRQVERFRQARRDGTYLDDYFMTKEDILGNKPSLGPEKSPAWKELDTLLGLGKVKESILSVVNQVNQNYQREMRGDDPLPITANRVFLGPPGTGKTTVAKLYGKILRDFGILSKGDVVTKNPTDLIDRYIGGSENNTKEALKQASGGILIIDDAHMLDPGTGSSGRNKNGDYRNGILDTLVAEVTGVPGEDRCVILCGYPEQMREMYRNCNPGFARRFPLDSAFVFEDFDAETLGKILDLKLSKEKLTCTDKAREVASDVLKRSSVRPNFGNGGEVESLVASGVLARNRRIVGQEKSDEQDADSVPLEPEDFDADWERHTRAVANTRALFGDMVGYEDIISKFEGFQYTAQGMRLRNIDPRPYIPFTYVFKGPPGTGKTSTARKMGQIFYDMGFLASPDVIDVSASDLIGEHCGETGPKTQRLLTSALGKVLFIDEAYRLGTGSPYTEEAVSELVDAVTKPRFARKLIIVLAGYEEDMERLMRTNPGMRSRFPTELVFRPMRAEQSLEHLRRAVSKVDIKIQATKDMDAATRTAVMGSLGKMVADKSWASGRSVETLGDKIIAHVFKECAMKGYAGTELMVTGKQLLTIVGGSSLAIPGIERWSQAGQMGARKIMTLKDLEGYE